MPQSFQQFVGDFGKYSWCVLFADAPIDKISNDYSNVLGREVATNVQVTLAEDFLYAPTGAIVQISGSSWAIIFHLVGEWDPFDAAAFSRKLDARVLEFVGEDTSGAVECKLFTPSGEATRYQTAEDAESEAALFEEVAEYAEGNEVPQQEASTVVGSYEELFQSLGIQPTKLSLGEDRSVIATAEDKYQIERVDLLREPS